ncbi:class I SAM-dependent methyltransferase [Marinobacter zhejiangensis]|uniref:Ubiquinone/menaquinone biosynthesis C-methylase UbiE n=1 Tax=Marinobacter zhejiangensis TaxID=488535 RepID=A0A1I4Q572_9GAMM|nr:class I SAM-dependent methyltransferase [Marinobacter zhejiangensis]SFM35006.1 Ubiquinone/menaquinone biosynthesis C-methylase UbiE [Marinobacter zhejiangensis]
MTQHTLEELEGTAREYDRRLRPTLFAPWVKHTLDYAHLRPGDDVLDVACGTGAAALGAVPMVSPGGNVTGLDLNPGMLAVARSKDSSVEWLQGAAETLPFDDNHFDAVVCQFGLMLFPDPLGALVEMQRVLKPGRHLVITVFADLEALPVYKALVQVYADTADPAIAELLRVPFAMGGREQLNRTFAAAAIPDTELVTRQEPAQFSSVRDLVLADIKGWFPFAGVDLSDATTEAVIASAEESLAEFVAADGSLTFPVTAHLVVSTKRDASRGLGKLAI